MNKKAISLMLFIFLCACVFQGCVVMGIKQLGRNNLNESVLENIVPCQTTKQEVVDMFRAPSEDFMRKQGEYDIYIYKGFGGRVKFDVQTLEVMFNQEGIVVDRRLNAEDAGLMKDQCDN